jgi:hypothetical protein
MIYLEYIMDQNQESNLRKRADAILEELGGLLYCKRFKTVSYDDQKIMFDSTQDSHHYDRHVSYGELQIQDLLFVSDTYLRRLPEIYDIHLFKTLLDHSTRGYFPFNNGEDNSCSKDKIEKLLFLINVSGILSQHIEENKTEYCQEIADRITKKNLESITAGLTIENDSGSEDPLFDQDYLSVVLGKDSPYRRLFYCDDRKDFDKTAERLSEITRGGEHPDSLQIPEILDSNYQPQELNTPDFSRPSVQDENPLKVILDKFLPSRERLKTEFWEKYLGAQCVLPEGAGRSI